MIDLNKQRETELNQALEAMYFGFKAIIAKPDEQLKALGLSRVHHRVLYFIGRNQGSSVSELLVRLKASKQYINKPLRYLIEQGYVLASPDAADKRIKRLLLSEKGMGLEKKLSGGQREHFSHVFEEAGVDAEQGWRLVMLLLAETPR